jgi:hypothetical protein
VAAGVYQGGTRLLQVVLPIASDQECMRSEPWLKKTKGLNFSNVLCTGGHKNHAACYGDSGGPVMVQSAGKVWVVGVTSHGSQLPFGAGANCDAEDRFGVSVRTAAYGQWIRAVMQSIEWPCNSCPCFSRPLSDAYSGLFTLLHYEPVYVDERSILSTPLRADSSHPNPSVFMYVALVVVVTFARER